MRNRMMVFQLILYSSAETYGLHGAESLLIQFHY